MDKIIGGSYSETRRHGTSSEWIMNVLLVNSRPSEPQGGELEPIGLCYLNAVLRQKGHDCFIIQQDFLSPFTDESILSLVKEKNIRLVGFSTYVTNASSALSMCRSLKEAGVHTILGGPLASGYPSLVERDEVDFLVQGEGEYGLLGLVEALQAESDFSGIPNLLFKTGGQVRHGLMGRRIQDLDALPVPDREHMQVGKTHMFGFPRVGGRNRAYSVLTSRGCPYACSYCVSDLMWHRQYYMRSVENVMDEMRGLFGPRSRNLALFVDEDVFVDRDRSLRLLAGMEESGLRVSFLASSHVHHLDEEMIGPMRRAGCFQIYLGMESGSPEILKKVNRRYDFEKSISIIKACHHNNIMIFCGFIVGFPWEDRSTMKQMRRLVRRLKADFYTFQYLQPYPGTLIHELAVREGWARPDYFFDYHRARRFFEPSMPTYNMTKSQLRREYILTQASTFLSPAYWGRNMKTLLSDPSRVRWTLLVLANVAQYSLRAMAKQAQTRLKETFFGRRKNGTRLQA